MQNKQSISIVGAGLAGSLLGVLLGQRGYRVKILESRADMRRQHVNAGRSINLALSSRGIHGLAMAGLMPAAEKLLIPMRGRMLHLENQPVQFMAYGQRSEEVIFSVSRRDLNCLMMTAAESAPDVELVYEQELQHVDFQQRQITIKDRSTGQVRIEPYELLVGADGSGSRVRRQMIPHLQGQSSSELLDHDYKELEIPAGPGGSYQIDAEALHIWPRGEYMLIALPNQDGSFTVTLFLPKEGNPSFATLTDKTSVREFFQQKFPDALALIPDLEQDFFANPQGILGTVRCRPWHYQDQAVLIGDAAHAIVPFHGQGMNASFEDCSELIRLLDQFDDDWEQVLPIYDRIRQPNADAIADMALENYITMRASVADPAFQLKKELGFELERRFPDRFIPRYSLVMFHRVPYAVAFRLGRIQQKILDRLASGKSQISQIDFAWAEELIITELPENVLEITDLVVASNDA